MQLGRERLTGSQVVVTAFDDVKYAIRGSGPPVLLVHGAGGEYGQGLIIGETFVGDGYCFIAPSRFGYLRSFIPQDGSPAAQADAYAALLDRLGIGRVAAVAFSDGGPSALQLALPHADRTAAPVMISPKSRTPPPTTALQDLVFERIFRSDYLYWAVSEAAGPFLLTGRPHAAWRSAAIVGIKLVHLAIFLVNSAPVLHIAWVGVRGRSSDWTRFALASALTELAVFVANRGQCPRTGLLGLLFYTWRHGARSADGDHLVHSARSGEAVHA